jgi:hypothetical protein
VPGSTVPGPVQYRTKVMAGDGDGHTTIEYSRVVPGSPLRRLGLGCLGSIMGILYV